MITRRMILPLLSGLLGTGVLLALGFWQIDRMGQKAAAIDAIEARIHDTPVPLPTDPDPERDRYRPVHTEGRFTGAEALVLSSQREAGPGYRVIAAFETATGQRILVDRGYVPQVRGDAPRPPSEGEVRIEGNLDWPQDSDRFTPDPDMGRNLFFSREVGPLAAHLDTQPALLVLRATTEPAPPAQPVPIATADIPDDHLEYAITWFSLAAVWAGMTAVLLWRMRREDSKDKAA